MKVINILFALLCLSGILISCQNENEIENSSAEAGFYISLNALGNEGATRDLHDDTPTSADENKISNLYALYFEEAGSTNDDYKLMGSSDGSVVAIEEVTDAAGKNLANADLIRLKPEQFLSTTANENITIAGSNRIIMFLANIGSTKPSYTKGTTLGTIKSGNILHSISGSHLLGSASTPIPMYVCTDLVKIEAFPYAQNYYVRPDNNTTTNPSGTDLQTYKLVRMLAKFTLTNKYDGTITDGSGVSNFLITKAYLVNAYSNGYVCYDNWSTTENRVTTATLTGTGTLAAATSTDMTPSVTVWDASNKPDQVITFYTCEKGHVSGSKLNNQSNFYIVLEGVRRKKNGVDLVDASGVTKKYMLGVPAVTYSSGTFTASETDAGDVLRNHHYNYTIQTVTERSLRVAMQVRPWSVVNIDGDPILIN